MQKSIDAAKVIQKIVHKMEERQEDNPEYIIQNIKLIDSLQKILSDFKQSLVDSMKNYSS
tara:strand:+ start:1262 stop:1441 length:180 start_codon:yes stop_codon:yes gene_type:complete